MREIDAAVCAADELTAALREHDLDSEALPAALRVASVLRRVTAQATPLSRSLVDGIDDLVALVRANCEAPELRRSEPVTRALAALQREWDHAADAVGDIEADQSSSDVN